jgi:hypothetical protein
LKQRLSAVIPQSGYKTRIAEIRSVIVPDMIDMEEFEVTAMTLMKQYHKGYYLALGHRTSPVTAFFRRVGRKTVSLRNLIKNLAEFVNNVINLNCICIHNLTGLLRKLLMFSTLNLRNIPLLCEFFSCFLGRADVKVIGNGDK